MADQPSVHIVDASVAIKLFLPEEHSENAERLFARLDSGRPFSLAAPDLLFIECAQVLWKRVTFKDMQREEAGRALATLLALPIASVPAAQLAPAALALAMRLGITAYDACYAALAQDLGAPLVTADKRLAEKLSKGRVTALWLGDC